MTKRYAAIIAALLTGLIITISLSSGTATVQAQTQNPWTAQFYSDTNFAAPIGGATATYSTLNLNWAGVPTGPNGNPIPGVPADNFSVIFTSSQSFSQGTYTFNVLADDYAELRVNGTTIINTEPAQQPNVNQSVSAIVAAGVYTVEVRLKEFTSAAIINVNWALGGGVPGQPAPGVTPGGPTLTPSLVPTVTQTPLPAIPPGALTATVIRASVLNIRAAPSLGGQIIGRVLRGQTYQIVGRDENARWFLLNLSGFQGWAYGYYLFFNRNEFTAPVVSGNFLLGLAGQPDTGVRAQTRATMRLRAEPNTISPQIGRVTWGAFIPIVGRTADNGWYQTVWRGTVGWVFSGFVRVLQGDLNDVPVR